MHPRSKAYKISIAFACVSAIAIGIMDIMSSEEMIHRLSGIINISGGVLVLGTLIDEDCERCHLRRTYPDRDEDLPTPK